MASVVGLHHAFDWYLETVTLQALNSVYAQRVFSDWYSFAFPDVILLDILHLVLGQSLADITVVWWGHSSALDKTIRLDWGVHPMDGVMMEN